ncbi:DMT family transporter [Campylobacter sp. JMF_08 NE1]|uniref:DMT family transporter n=1 Tax=Campylobacter sp. JMF_08 NE1 TaxID=2983821 RepID=UPI0022E9CC08|nr:DMT family transporter [Campylobacter sp. JMF_08 NE1]MDA3048703.1 DMT family transporter [Campylobacter sp. JMF_08 NE1]
MGYSKFWLKNLGVYYMLIASFYFALNGALAKVMAEQMSSVEIVFFRNAVGLAIMLISLKRLKNFGVGGKPWLLFFRAFIGSCGIIATFYNIAHIELGTAFTFQKTAPIFTALFSSIFLGEKLSFKGWCAIMLGFSGILLVIQPHISIAPTDIIGVFGGMCAGLAYTSVRELRKYYATDIIILVFVFGAALVSSALMCAEFALRGREIEILGVISSANLSKFAYFNMPSLFGWVLVALLGISGIYFQKYMTRSYAASKKAGVVAAISYTDIIFTLILGVMLGDSLPNLMAFLGILVVIISGVLIARER